ncbi:hypothetical protein L218DRAFT_1082028 [Marasmius fiardii PR-910]|nr:hypothetical protein L218DRAFT_1082028 [Marasmius fiardii PR-910]
MPKILVASLEPHAKKFFHPYKRPSLHLKHDAKLATQGNDPDAMSRFLEALIDLHLHSDSDPPAHQNSTPTCRIRDNTSSTARPRQRPDSTDAPEQNEIGKFIPPLQNQDDYEPIRHVDFLLTTLCVVILLTWRMFGLLGG